MKREQDFHGIGIRDYSLGCVSYMLGAPMMVLSCEALKDQG